MVAQPDIFQGEIYGVQKRRPSFRSAGIEIPLQPAHVSREILRDPGPVIELQQEILVIWIPSFQEVARGRASDIERITHAPARVKNETHTHRRVLGRKISDLLLYLIFPNVKILCAQALNWSILAISNGYRDENYIKSDLNRLMRYRSLRALGVTDCTKQKGHCNH